MNIYPELHKEWITSSLAPEEIRGKPVWIMLKGGQKKQERFEIEDVNDMGEVLIRIDYNSSPYPNRVSFASFRVTQEQLNSWIKDNQVVLNVP